MRYYTRQQYRQRSEATEQEEWLDALKQQGYFTAVCYGAEEAEKVIAEYLGFPAPGK